MLLGAHRTTSVRRCDRVVMLHEGRNVDIGSVDELAARSAEYRALAAMPDELDVADDRAELGAGPPVE